MRACMRARVCVCACVCVYVCVCACVCVCFVRVGVGAWVGVGSWVGVGGGWVVPCQPATYSSVAGAPLPKSPCRLMCGCECGWLRVYVPVCLPSHTHTHVYIHVRTHTQNLVNGNGMGMNCAAKMAIVALLPTYPPTHPATRTHTLMNGNGLCRRDGLFGLNAVAGSKLSVRGPVCACVWAGG